jgi:hypothetical protein
MAAVGLFPAQQIQEEFADFTIDPHRDLGVAFEFQMARRAARDRPFVIPVGR